MGPSAVVAIRSGGLATSSTAARRWRRGGDVLHHILDPRSGLPAAPVWRTVSVAAATCTDANIASTAAIIRGEAAPAWLAGLGLAARLVAESGAVLTLGGWPANRPIGPRPPDPPSAVGPDRRRVGHPQRRPDLRPSWPQLARPRRPLRSTGPWSRLPCGPCVRGFTGGRGALSLRYRQNCGIAQQVTIAVATLSRPPDQAANCGPASAAAAPASASPSRGPPCRPAKMRLFDPPLHGVRGHLLHDHRPEHRGHHVGGTGHHQQRQRGGQPGHEPEPGDGQAPHARRRPPPTGPAAAPATRGR